MVIISNEEMKEMLLEEVKKLGTKKEAAKKMNISPTYLGDILKNNNFDIPHRIGRYFGFKREIVWRKTQ